MKLKFANPICEITKMTFLDIEKKEKTSVTARDSSGNEVSEFVEPGGDSMPTSLMPTNFLDVKQLTIQIGNGKATGSGALASIEMAFCVSKFDAVSSSVD